MFKIVDDFNGFEDDRRFSNLHDTQRHLEHDVAAFHRANSKNTICRLTVVEADAEWAFDERQNRFVWRS